MLRRRAITPVIVIGSIDVGMSVLMKLGDIAISPSRDIESFCICPPTTFTALISSATATDGPTGWYRQCGEADGLQTG